MSTKAEVLRLPRATRSNRPRWYALLTLIVAVGVAVTVLALSSSSSTTAPERLGPATGSRAGGTTTAVAPQSNVLQVGGTSVYRYHPLPGTNTVFELSGASGGPAPNPGDPNSGDPKVGGGGTYRYHQLP